MSDAASIGRPLRAADTSLRRRECSRNTMTAALTENRLKLSRRDALLRQLVIQKGFADAPAIDLCVATHRKLIATTSGKASRLSIGDLLVARGLLTRAQLNDLLISLNAGPKPPDIPGYDVLSRLGSGATATVYKAKQLSLDRFVAIKVLPQSATRKPAFVERFYAEGRAAARLNHPNIVHAIDVGQAGNRHYFIMEYVQGRTLHDDLAEAVVYEEDEALKIITKVVRGLAHAHGAGLVHRDVKPMNILLTPAGGVKVADLGLAHDVDNHEQIAAEKGAAVGTPYFMSPEQARGDRHIDFRSDIYALGATLYVMLTGRVPFDGTTSKEVRDKHIHAALVPPAELNGRISEDMNQIILVCMAKDQADRYDETSHLIQDLEAVRHGETPLQAALKRKTLDAAAHAAHEIGNDLPTAVIVGEAQVDGSTAPALMEERCFWLAVGGWAAALAFGVLWVITMV